MYKPFALIAATLTMVMVTSAAVAQNRGGRGRVPAEYDWSARNEFPRSRPMENRERPQCDNGDSQSGIGALLGAIAGGLRSGSSSGRDERPPDAMYDGDRWGRSGCRGSR